MGRALNFSPSKNRGWMVVVAGFIATLTFGEIFWSFGVFFKVLMEEFGWSRSLESSAYMWLLFGYSTSVIVSGRLADRYRPRPILLASALVTGLGMLLCSRIGSITELQLFFFIIGLGSGPTWSVPSTTVQRWFSGKKGAGLALGTVASGVGFGSLVFAPLINYSILNYGWRTAYLVAATSFVLLVVISALLVRPSPRTAFAGALASKQSRERDSERLTVARFFASKAFIIAMVGLCAGSMAFYVVSVHLVPYSNDVGISQTAAATALGFMGGFSIPGRIVAGLVGDRLSWRKTMGLGLVGLAIALLILMAVKSVPVLYVFALVFGVSHGARISASVGILDEFFGTSSLGVLIGVTNAAAMVTGGFAPFLAGFAFDQTGSYSIVVLALAAVLALSGVTLLFTRSGSR